MFTQETLKSEGETDKMLDISPDRQKETAIPKIVQKKQNAALKGQVTFQSGSLSGAPDSRDGSIDNGSIQNTSRSGTKSGKSSPTKKKKKLNSSLNKAKTHGVKTAEPSIELVDLSQSNNQQKTTTFHQDLEEKLGEVDRIPSKSAIIPENERIQENFTKSPKKV